MSQKVIGRQEGFPWDRSPVLRPGLQAHVDPLGGSPAVKLLIIKHLEENSSHQEAGMPEDGAAYGASSPEIGGADWAPESRAPPLLLTGAPGVWLCETLNPCPAQPL